MSFGERLRSSKDKEEEEVSDEEKRLNLTEQEGEFVIALLGVPEETWLMLGGYARSDDGGGRGGFGIPGAREAVHAEHAEPVEGARDGYAASQCAARGWRRRAVG